MAAAHSIEALLEQAESAMTNMNFELATRFAERALQQDAGHAGAVECRALIAHQMGEIELSQDLLKRCIELEPDQGSRKYLFLGQMLTGEEAANCLGKGIELLAAEAQQLAEQGPEYEDEVAQMHADIAAAFCSLAEVYLTDLCDVEDAQDTCLTLMNKALEYDPQNPQTLQTLASVHMSMAQPEDALRYLNQSLALWYKEPSEDEDAEEEEEEDQKMTDDAAEQAAPADDDDDDKLPPYEFRINTAKLLLELGDTERALAILDQLLIEDEEIMQVWYLQGWALHMTGDDACVESLEKAREVYRLKDCDRPEVLEHIEELLAEHTGAASSS